MVSIFVFARGRAPERIRTSDPRLRRPLLYPPELLAHIEKSRSYHGCTPGATSNLCPDCAPRDSSRARLTSGWSRRQPGTSLSARPGRAKADHVDREPRLSRKDAGVEEGDNGNERQSEHQDDGGVKCVRQDGLASRDPS